MLRFLHAIHQNSIHSGAHRSLRSVTWLLLHHWSSNAALPVCPPQPLKRRALLPYETTHVASNLCYGSKEPIAISRSPDSFDPGPLGSTIDHLGLSAGDGAPPNYLVPSKSVGVRVTWQRGQFLPPVSYALRIRALCVAAAPAGSPLRLALTGLTGSHRVRFLFFDDKVSFRSKVTGLTR